MVITFTDISVLKMAEAVVRDSQDAIIVQDLGGHIVAWNPGAERLYGWSEDEALERSYRSLLVDRDAARAMAELRLRAELIPSVLVNDGGEVYAIATTERAS